MILLLLSFFRTCQQFVEADECLGTKEREWGGPRRGGRMPEPTRYGDWERKGRCTDF